MPADWFERKVQAAIRRFEMLPRGSRAGIAVSGGADSVALLFALHNLAPEHDWQLSVLHVNHHLRGAESDDDCRFVEALASRLGLFLQKALRPVHAPGGSAQGNLEKTARDLRYQWFTDCALCKTMHNVATGHTRSDQAETVLFRFLRGSGAAGLSGILPVRNASGVRFVRPLFDVTRDEARLYLREIGETWRDDSSNTDLRFDRNRIRLDLLPHLAHHWNPRIESTLAATGEWARAEEHYWQQIVSDLAVVHLTPAFDGAQLCTTAALNSLPVAAARRLIRHAILLIKGDLHSIDFSHIEQIRALAQQPEGSGRLQTEGVDIIRSFDWIRFAAPGTYGGDRFFSLPVVWPCEIDLPESTSRLTLQVGNADNLYNDSVNRLDGDRISGPLELRTWRPGDQYQNLGSSSPVKLKTLFQEARIPIWERRTWPILAAGSAIVWSRRFGVAAGFAADPSTRCVVTIVEKKCQVPDNGLQNGNQ